MDNLIVSMLLLSLPAYDADDEDLRTPPTQPNGHFRTKYGQLRVTKNETRELFLFIVIFFSIVILLG